MSLTVEKLEAALRDGNEKAVIALFKEASEPERQAVAALALKWHKRQAAQPFYQSGPGSFTRNPLLTAAEAAVLASASFSELKKLGWRGLPVHDLAFQVLAARRPSWAGDWALMLLEFNPRNLALVRRLMREGLCHRPETDNYWLGLFDTRMLPGFGKGVRDGLLADPDLLEDVWKVFEIEGGGEYSLAAHDKYMRAELSWETGLVQLANEGKLSRARLLDASLEALARDFAQFRAGWFSRFHEALQPTLDERAERAERYLHLLASKISPTVSFALNALSLLDRAGRLPAAAVATHSGPALLARSKGAAREALKLLDRAAQREPTRKDEIVRVAAEAIRHEASEVQGAVLDLIEKHGSRTDGSLVELLRAQMDAVAASQRQRLQTWLGEAPTQRAKMPKKKSANDHKDLLQRAKKIEPALARLAGVEQAVAALQAGSAHIPAAEFTAFDIPHLRAESALAPIEDLDELIDRFAAVLEDPGAPEDIESVLDGVSRLCDRRPDDFTRRTGPLSKRAHTLLKRRWGGAFRGTGPLPDLCGLAIAWITGELPPPTGQRLADETMTVLNFLTRRVLAIAERARKAIAEPLLAAPTHRGAWIDPLVLVERFQSWPMTAEPNRFDEIQALLRLAPDNRSSALRKSAKLPGEFGEALRYALGAKSKIGPTASLWVAAARARQPFSDDPQVETRHPGLGPDAGAAARFSIASRRRGQNWHYVHVEPEVPTKVSLEMPTVLLHAGYCRNSGSAISRWDAPNIRWAGSIWPLGRESWFAAGVGQVGGNLDWWEANWGNRAYLEPLLDPDVPLLEMALTLLTLGLAAKEPGESGLCTDALIAAIDDGRLDGLKLGAKMASLFIKGPVKAARWAKTLTDASRISPQHSASITLTLQGSLESIPDPVPKDLGALLETLKELLIARGECLSLPKTREALTGLKASGKTAKFAKDILALQPNAAISSEEGAARALAARLQRAERWAV
jgi:Family of unknown function (DUF6493)